MIDYKKILSALTKAAPVFISAAFVTLILLFCPRTYFENDNLGIIGMIKENTFAVFFSPFLGKILSFLYEITNHSIAWYAVFIYIAHTISIALFLYCVMLFGRSSLLVSIGSSVLYLTLYSYLIIRTGYNSASILLTINTVLFFYYYYERLNYLHSFLLAGLLLFASQFRYAGFQLGLLVSISFIITLNAKNIIRQTLAIAISLKQYMVARLKKREQTANQTNGLNESIFNPKKLALVIATFWVLHVLIRVVVSLNTPQEHKDFMKFNGLRGQFHDFPIAKKIANEELLQANNWTANDYNMFRSWVFLDEEKYNIETVSNIFKYTPKDNNTLFTTDNISQKLAFYWDTYNNLFFLFAIILFFSTIQSGVKSQKSILLILYILGIVTFFMVFLIVKRFPDRIGIPAFLGLTGQGLLFICQNSKNTNRYLNKAFVSAMLVLSVLSIIKTNKFIETIGNSRQDRADRISAKIAEFRNSFEDDVIFLIHHRAIRSQFTDTLRISGKSLMQTIPNGWLIFSPCFYNRLQRAGFNSGKEFLRKAINNKRIMFVMLKDNKSWPNMFRKYYKEKYDVKVKFRKVKEIEDIVIGYFAKQKKRKKH